MNQLRLFVSRLALGLVALSALGLLVLFAWSSYNLFNAVVVNDTPGQTLREAMGLPR